jgi:hypothetical protein
LQLHRTALKRLVANIGEDGLVMALEGRLIGARRMTVAG